MANKKRPARKLLAAVLQGSRLCHTCHTRYVYSHDRLEITCDICKKAIADGVIKRGN